jgi:hypothetical protein
MDYPRRRKAAIRALSAAESSFFFRAATNCGNGLFPKAKSTNSL